MTGWDLYCQASKRESSVDRLNYDCLNVKIRI
uniref:Uncharacterized protein n=1 Tax=Anguilla anguilla TaxID=7936 RepID=A0A0E9TXF5_ANGAN